MYAVYLFGGVLAVLLLVVVSAALQDRAALAPRPENAAPEERQRAALDALRELEFDHLTGKISDEEYRALHRRYARAALAARDELAAAGNDRGGGDGRVGGNGLAGHDDGISCPACKAPVRPGAHYCSRCGTPIPAENPGQRRDEHDR